MSDMATHLRVPPTNVLMAQSADVLESEKIRVKNRDGWACCVCGQAIDLEVCHFLAKSDLFLHQQLWLYERGLRVAMAVNRSKEENLITREHASSVTAPS